MDIYTKIRTLASIDPVLQSYFGNSSNSTFRWFKQRLQPGYLSQGTCARVTRISTAFGYTNAPTGLMNLNQPRMDIQLLDFDSTRLAAAALAVITWMGTVSFATNDDFNSPPTTPPNSPNFLLNRFSRGESQVDPPGEAYVELLEFRIYNLEN